MANVTRESVRLATFVATMACAIGAAYTKEFGFAFAIVAYGLHNYNAIITERR